jgi:hypothetical protein
MFIVRLPLRVKIESVKNTFFAQLDSSLTSNDFAAMLPLKLQLNDYAATELVADLPKKLTVTGSPNGYQANVGDITYYAPWGNLAIFYKPFQFASGLVRLGAFEGDFSELVTSAPTDVFISKA